MIKFLLYIISFVGSVFLFSMAINYGLKLAGYWDDKVNNKLNRSFQGFNWYFRIPFSVGVIPEYFFYLVLRAENYFKTNWWALKLFAFNTFLIFIAVLSNNSVVNKYYSYSYYADNGINALFTSGITFWYLNIITLFFLVITTLIIIESVRMHRWYAPVRIILYSMLSFFMAAVTLMVLSLIITITALYIAYKIIKFLFFSSSRKQTEGDDDEDVSDQFNNSYRRFRAELYDWESSYKTSNRAVKKEIKKPTIKRKHPKVERKPKPKSKPKSGNDDIPRFYPD
jgi:hypothetical protein